MFEEKSKNGNTENFQPKEKEQDLDRLDNIISDIIQSLEATGLNMDEWNHEYEHLPNEVVAFEDFHNKLWAFKDRRQDALSSLEFDIDMPEEEKERIRQFDQEVRRAFKDHNNFLGNGATAEVYGMINNDTVCVKFITNQERYDENNTIRREHNYLSKVYERTKNGNIRTPYPIFLRVHPSEGHSYGMEKIQGASLSQILEFPEKYPELIEVAHRVDRKKLEADLQVFVKEMHESGATHSDLFKRNIMLDGGGRLYVIDFGKAKTIEFPGDKEDECKSDVYTSKQSLRDFWSKLDHLTN